MRIRIVPNEPITIFDILCELRKNISRCVVITNIFNSDYDIYFTNDVHNYYPQKFELKSKIESVCIDNILKVYTMQDDTLFEFYYIGLKEDEIKELTSSYIKCEDIVKDVISLPDIDGCKDYLNALNIKVGEKWEPGDDFDYYEAHDGFKGVINLSDERIRLNIQYGLEEFMATIANESPLFLIQFNDLSCISFISIENIINNDRVKDLLKRYVKDYGQIDLYEAKYDMDQKLIFKDGSSYIPLVKLPLDNNEYILFYNITWITLLDILRKYF